LNQILKAIELYQKRRSFYRSVDIRIAAVNVENSWYNLRTKILLSYSETIDLIQRKIDVGDFVVFSGNIKADDFPTLLQNIDQDKFEVDGNKIDFFAGQNHDLSYDNWFRASSERSRERWNMEWPLDVFRWQVSHRFQNEMFRILENISLKLNCHTPPYEDASKAIRELLELHEYEFRQYDGGRESGCMILLPNYLAITKCRLEGNHLDFEARFHPSVDYHNICLNIIAKGKETQKSQILFTKKDVKQRQPFELIRKRIRLRDIADVQAYLFLKDRESEGPSDICFTRNLKATINPRFLAHETYDTDAVKLREWLLGDGKVRSDNFEQATTILLHACGFFTEWLGRKDLAQDAPDIVAFSPETQVLIVAECKTNVFEWKEIKKLKDRTKKLYQELRIDAYPVVFARVKPNEIDEEIRKKARNEDVTILTIQEMDELLKMALRGRGVRDVLNQYFQYTRPYSPR